MSNLESTPPGLPSNLTRGVPDKEVIVAEGTTISTGEGDLRTSHVGGEHVTLAGPEADDLVLAGYCSYA
jgi:hypothetical protein